MEGASGASPPPRISRRALGGLLGACGAAGLVSACSPSAPHGPTTATAEPSTVASARVASLVAGMPERSLKPIAMDRLAEGLTPPTNRWFSGLVFGAQPQPVFPLPLGFALLDTGFEIWLPAVVVTDKAIIGQRSGGLQLRIRGAGSVMVVGYDVASVTLAFSRPDAGDIAEVRLVQGSPCVTVTAKAVDAVVSSQIAYGRAGSAWQADVGPTSFGVVGGRVDGSDVTVPAGGTAVWFVAPTGVEVADLAGLAAPVTGTMLSWSTAEDTVTTKIGYQGGPTLLVSMPHHEEGLVGGRDVIGEFSSVFGPLRLRHSDSIEWTSRRRTIIGSLDVSGLDASQRRRLAALAAVDVGRADPYPADSYFGGKALYRDSQLIAIARQVGVDVGEISDRVTASLRTWAEVGGARGRGSRCFVYDPRMRGVVGLEPSFGSEEFNDHHFHYGYFLHAAGTMCEDNRDLAAQLAPVFDLLAADIAAPNDDGLFPQLRCFDVYASHSWASGTAPFADGNNQESSSEAAHAWAGLALWARARGDAALEQQAVWMHALETESALAYWLRPDLTAFRDYRHRVVGIGWGAKRDYATWFSADPMAILMIQLIPAGPSSGYLASDDPEQIADAVAEAVGTGGFDRRY